MIRMTTRALFSLFILLLALLLSSVFLLGATTAHAAECPTDITGAGGFVPLECFQDSARLRGAYNEPELGPFIQRIFVGAISLGAVLAVLRLAWAGFIYMGTDRWGDKGRARDIISDTLLGLFLLLAIWLILKQINPQILELKINTSSVPSDVMQKQPM